MHPYVGAKPSHFLGRSVFGGQGPEEASTMLGGKKKRSVWPKTATGDRICALTPPTGGPDTAKDDMKSTRTVGPRFGPDEHAD